MKISAQERDAVYKTIFSRRDVRGEYLPDPVPEDVLKRVLTAAHHAPSVGFMQPWDFIVVRDAQVRHNIKQGFNRAHEYSAGLFDAEKQDIYRGLKLEGIEEAPLGVCITCDRNRNGPVVIGRTVNPQMDLYSSVCAVQNLWLAARAENLGVGWVSIIDDQVLRDELGIPDNIDIIAWLCIGYVSFFHEKPELEKAGWLPRRSLDDAIHSEQWQALKHE